MQERPAGSAGTAVTADLLTAHQVGDLLDVDTSTVYRMAADGRLPAVKIGRQWRFPAGQVRQLLDVGATVPNATSADPGGALDAQLAASVVSLVAESLGVMMVVTDMDGQPITPVVNPCPWFAERADDPEILTDCVSEWRRLADDLVFAPRFITGTMGFRCARSFIRSGNELVGMVLAGGVAADSPNGHPDGLYHLDDAAERRVLEMLPRTAATLSRLAGHAHDDPDHTNPPRAIATAIR
jgi:excisionase family DNA binding protein